MDNLQLDKQDSIYQEAQKHVRQIREFYNQLVVYLAVNALLIAINLIYNPDNIWFIWPLLGWGIGVAFHANSVFQPFGSVGRSWEERKIQEYIEKKKDQAK